MKLRDYQIDAQQFVLKHIANRTKSQLIKAPTGAGKTVIATFLIDEFVQQGKKVFFVVANEPLIMQSYSKFTDKGIKTSIIKAGYGGYYNPTFDCQLIMMQSFNKRINILKDLKADIIIIDEIDFGFKGNMLKKMKEKFPEAQIIGLTATPIDEKGFLLDGFDAVYQDLQVKHLQAKEQLSIDYNYAPFTPDLSKVKISTTGEFDEQDLDTACNNSYIIDTIIDTYKKVDKGYKTLVFAINIPHAESIKTALQRNGYTAGVIHSKMKKASVEFIINKHKAGDIRFLVNVGMLTRGYDCPDIIDLVCARPTMSLRLYDQIIGRAARLDGVHNFFRHFDYAGNIARHGLWSDERYYFVDNRPKVIREENEDKNLIVCPGCFKVIFSIDNTCPECNFNLETTREIKEREIQENKRAEQLIEVKKQEVVTQEIINTLKTLILTRPDNSIDANTLYYKKIIPIKPLNWSIDYYHKLIREKANYCIKNKQKALAVFMKIKNIVDNYNILCNNTNKGGDQTWQSKRIDTKQPLALH